MRRFGKFRTRLLSSLKKQRTPRSSTSSSAAADHQSSVRMRRRESSSDHGSTIDAGAGSSSQKSPRQQQQQLHWSEARRIYSEPATREMKIESSSDRDSSSTCSSSNLAPAAASVAHHPHSGGAASSSEKIKGKNRRRNHHDVDTQTLQCSSCAEDAPGDRKDSALADLQYGESDDDDDVFLESWEEISAANDRTTTNLSSSSGIGSLRDNITSAASSSCNYFNPSNSPQSLTSASPLSLEELQRHSACSGVSGGHGLSAAEATVNVLPQVQNVPEPTTTLEHGLGMGREQGGWEEWKIPSSEISLGAILHQSQMETVYRGYWHGAVHVHTRRVREVVDVERFLDEVATLNCIRHENIQLFMGASLDMQCGTVALVMSELKGSSLSTRLHKLGHNFTAPSKTKILRQISEGMEYLHAKEIPHGLLTSSSISLHHRACISLAPPHTRHAHNYFYPHQLTYLPPECVRELRVVQPSSSPSSSLSSPHPTSPGLATTSTGDTLTRLSSLGSTNCLTFDKSYAARSKAPSSPSLAAMATGGGGSRALWTKRGSESYCSANGGGQVVGSQLKTKMPPTTAADVFAFGTIVYELVSLEHAYKHLPAECVIWQVGQGKTQPVTLLPRGRFRNIINSCWRENPQKRPTFTEILVILEETVVPISSKSVSCSCSSRLKPSRSLPSLNSAPNSASLPANHFPN